MLSRVGRGKRSTDISFGVQDWVQAGCFEVFIENFLR